MKAHLTKAVLFTVTITVFINCNMISGNNPATITSEPFGTLPDGQEVTQYILTNSQGMEMKALTYGGIIRSLTAPDKEGNLEDIVLGYDSLDGYLSSNLFFGAIVGRVANRISNGRFTLDGVEYTLSGASHGGRRGFDKKIWNANAIELEDGVALELSYTSADMEEGYPGNLDVTVTYTLKNDNTLTVDYKGVTDKPTIVNMTQHSYFNLSAMEDNILSHELVMNADSVMEVEGSNLIPTGDFIAVKGTPFDFTEPTAVGENIDAEYEQLRFGRGFDHSYALNKNAGEQLGFAASLYHAESGRKMEVYTTSPGVHLYSANWLNENVMGKDGVINDFRTGLCFETQHFPDSPNQPGFPSIALYPGEEYSATTTFIFSADDEM